MQVRLKNRRIQLRPRGCAQHGPWDITMKKLVSGEDMGEPELRTYSEVIHGEQIVTTRILLTNEAMLHLVLMFLAQQSLNTIEGLLEAVTNLTSKLRKERPKDIEKQPYKDIPAHKLSNLEFMDLSFDYIKVQYPVMPDSPQFPDRLPPAPITTDKVYKVLDKWHKRRVGCFVRITNDKGNSHYVDKQYVVITKPPKEAKDA